MKVVYIAGPFRGANAWEVEKNIRHAEGFAFKVANLGAMPMCPHTNTRFFDGTLTADFWIAGTLELMRRCDAVMLIPGWKDSDGARAEFDEAVRLIIPTFIRLADLDRWIHV